MNYSIELFITFEHVGPSTNVADSQPPNVSFKQFIFISTIYYRAIVFQGAQIMMIGQAKLFIWLGRMHAFSEFIVRPRF